MHYALLSQAREWIKTAYAETDADILTEVVNSIRREWYAWYEATPLHVDIEECFELQTFCVDCSSYSDTYRGVTLPRGYEAVEAMWLNTSPVALHSRWRQWQQGMATNYSTSALNKFDMGDAFATEREIHPVGNAHLLVSALNAEDEGKRFVLRGTSFAGHAITQTFALSQTAQRTDLAFRGVARQGGVSKDITKGPVLLAQDGGRILSIYAPNEQVPAYKRIKITGLPTTATHVNIRAARHYVDVFDDYDVVESDNSRAWEAMARALRLNRKAERSGSDMRSEAGYRAEARELLLGDRARSTGKSTQTRVEVRVPHMMPLMGRR